MKFKYRACSAVVKALRFGTQGPGSEPSLFFPQSMLHASSWLLNEAKSFLKFKYNFTSLKTNPNTHSNVFFTNFFV